MILNWLRGEMVTLTGIFGAAITILAQLSRVLPLTPWLAEPLAWWEAAIHYLWRPILELFGIELHPHLVGALNAAAFLTMIGIGVRISAKHHGTPLAPLLTARWLDDMSWPSLAVFAALCFVFLFGHDPEPSGSAPLMLFGSRNLGTYAFALVVTAGYIAGDFIGHHEFHHRLYRLAALVVATIALNFALHCGLQSSSP